VPVSCSVTLLTKLCGISSGRGQRKQRCRGQAQDGQYIQTQSSGCTFREYMMCRTPFGLLLSSLLATDGACLCNRRQIA
jgi:hypothetical protein